MTTQAILPTIKIRDVVKRGQVFTPSHIVDRMLLLRKNYGSVLDPSAGDGAFYEKIEHCVGIEKDISVVVHKNISVMDFFDYPLSNTFDTIIGNPPYVKHNDIEKDTQEKLDYRLFDKRTNLYLFFIEKCIKHLKNGGELIFITPREFIDRTSARKLNEYIYHSGTITDYFDLGDGKIFHDACPNVAIWRFCKGDMTHRTSTGSQMILVNGKIIFKQEISGQDIALNEIFDIKVGAVSGADHIFTNVKGNMEFVCSHTRRTGKTKRMFYNVENNELRKHRDALMRRKIKTFSESNWYMWGRDYYKSEKSRIYVNNKTRIKNPFFMHRIKNYDGSVLALFPKDESIDVQHALNVLNDIDWGEQGFLCDGRYIFGQRSLSNALVPREAFYNRA